MNYPLSSPPTEHTSPESAGTPAAPGPKALDGQLSERGVVMVTALGHFICHLAETVYPAVMIAVMIDFALSTSAAASLATLGYVLLGAGAIPVGIWADRWGQVRVFRIYFLLMAATAALVALTPDGNIWFLFGSLTLLGLAASIYHPVGLAMLSLGVKKRGRAMGINGVAGNFGIALGPALGIALCFSGWWRLAYVVVAVLSLISFVGFCWMTRQRKNEEMGGWGDGEMGSARPQGTGLEAPHLPTSSSPDLPTSPSPHLPISSSLARWLPLILLYAAMVCGGFNYRFLMTALPVHVSGKQAAADVRSNPQETGTAKIENATRTAPAGTQDSETTSPSALPPWLYVLVALLIGGVGQYAGGWLSDRFGARYVYPTLIACVVPLAILVGMLGGSALVLLPACLLAASLFGQQPVENSVLAERTSRGRRGLSYATKFTLTFGVGALGASVAGLVWEHISLSAVFYLLAGSAVLMAVLAATALSLRTK